MKFNFETLEVWQEAIAVSKLVYKTTANFPVAEKYTLTDQLRCATISIALNIAEGKGRSTNKEFKRFLDIARGSLYEFVTCIEIAFELGYLNANQKEQFRQKTTLLMRKITNLIQSLKVPAKRMQAQSAVSSSRQ